MASTEIERVVEDPDSTKRDQYNQHGTWEENLRRLLQGGNWRVVSASFTASGLYPVEQRVELELVRIW